MNKEPQPNSPERGQQIKLVFQAALAIAPEQRRAFITQACADDPLLRHEVDLMLLAYEESSGNPADAAKLTSDTSTLFPGQTFLNRLIGHYRIVRLLGRGGMGEVWQAEDTRLGRRVALKLLPAEFSNTPERLQRFAREARAVSSLNHPNIITIHEIGQADGVHYIVTEFVDGQTLRQQMSEMRRPVSEVLDIVMQVADALGVAHAAGIVHRDVKAENVMVRRDGRIKLLDFGLARVMKPASSDTVTEQIASTITSPGLVIGTLACMSPEQARGQEVDARTDIFSLGVMLYEMLFGRAPFAANSPGEMLAAVLTFDPPVPTTQPPALQNIVRKALSKERERRYQTMQELLVELKKARQELEADNKSGVQTLEFGLAHTLPIEPATVPSSAEIIFTEIKRHKRGFALTVSLLLLGFLAIGYGLYRWITHTTAQRAAAPFQTMRLNRVTTSGKVAEEQAVISPDGKYLVYAVDEAGQQGLWVKQVMTNATVQIAPPSDVTYLALTISHDSNYIYYLTIDRAGATAIHRVASIGGTARKLITEVSRGLSLSPDDQQMVFVRNDPQSGESALIVASSEGTNARKIATRLFPNQFSAPAWSPDGETIACVSTQLTATGRFAELVGIAVATGKEQLLSQERWSYAGQMAWLPDSSGLLINAADQSTRPSQIWLTSLADGTTRKITNDLNNYSGLSLTANAQTMVTVQMEKTSQLWVTVGGKAEQAKRLISGNGKYEGVMGLYWSPDNHILYSSTATTNPDLVGGDPDLWRMRADGDQPTQLTFNARANTRPVTTADGRLIIWTSNRAGNGNIWRMNTDGSNPQKLTNGIDDVAPDCSPDGRWVVYQGIKDTKPVLLKVSMDGGEPVPLTQETAARPAVSPDGQWLACYYLDEKSKPYRWRLALLPFAGGAPSKLLELSQTADRLISPRWTPDGQALLYVDTQGGVSNVWRLPINGGAPEPFTNFTSDLIFNFALSRDGQQLICARGTITHDVVTISNFR
ncbi:MAG TPA: protein kinase [Blastocatellia bacterium]|nr:protein kinase [Blastocatellia bacterium]